MDFRFTDEELRFRADVRQYLRSELPEGWASQPGVGGLWAGAEAHWETMVEFQRGLARRGWLTLGWPTQEGGLGASPVMQAIYNEEMTYERAPSQLGVGPDRVGPTLLMFGTPSQRAEHLTRIRDASVVWCQGFSEPGAGSDLASLQTRATREGDEFVISGQKIWTSYAHRADWCILLARTDPSSPKHKGITYFLLDMKSPGVTVSPLVDLTGEHTFNQVFLDNVRVSADAVVGEVNRGWYVATATLDFERSGITRVAAGVRLFDDLVGLYRSLPAHERKMTVRNQLAELAIEFTVGRLLAYRVAWLQSKGQLPNAEAAMSKVFGSELQQRLALVASRATGLRGILDAGRFAALGGKVGQFALLSPAMTIAAGTSEVGRGIIAARGLGLPRG